VKSLQITAAVFLAGALSAAFGQSTEPPAPSASGRVIFSRGEDSATPRQPITPETPVLGVEDPLSVTETERSALTFTSYDLDVHLTPTTSSISIRAAMAVRNDGPTPISRAVLQISSTLRWDAISLAGKALPVVTRIVETDADHTGAMDEAVIELPRPLAPGASLSLTALYSGTISLSAQRLERTGAPPAQARKSDWDTIGSEGTFLRGFGYVLWYPVSSSPLFFREGDRLFQSIGAMRLRESSSSVRLRLAVEYRGEPPDAAFFAGRRETLKAISDNPDAPAAEAPGVATAAFDAGPLGFRSPGLFITDQTPAQTGTAENPELISAVTSNEAALATYSAAAGEVEPLLREWYGANAESPLYLIDHPGQPFEDDTLLLRPLAFEDAVALPAELAHSLTHVWIHSAHPWIDEGLAEFSRLLWLERTRGHEAANAALQESCRNLAAAESSPVSNATAAPAQSSSSSSSDEPPAPAQPGLTEATSEVFYRTKAAAVWWMLRGIVGDQALQHSLQAYRADAHADHDPQGMERTLERFSHKDLRWFFDDWVYHDRGLPRLSIASVAPSELKGRTGVPDGWLIAVEVRNDGDAVADVPVNVSSSVSSQTERLRIAAHSTASTRIVFAGTPEQVLVNDGSVPESGPTTHTRQLTLLNR
jgi:hypothetical protein